MEFLLHLMIIFVGMEPSNIQIRQFISFVKAIAITHIVIWHFDKAWYIMSGTDKLSIGDYLAQLFSLNLSETFLAATALLTYTGPSVTILLFVVSGLGLYLSFHSRKQNWTRFYYRRFMRIVPLYWMILIIRYLLNLEFNTGITLKSFIYHMLFMQTFTPHHLDFGAFWFIGVLVYFYLMFPAFIFMFRNPTTMWILIIVSVFAHSITTSLLEFSGYVFIGRLPTRYIQYFVFGMLFGKMVIENKLKAVTSGAYFICAICAIALLAFSNISGSFKFYSDTSQLLLLFWALYIPSTILSKVKIISYFISMLSYASFVAFHMHQDFFRLVLYYVLKMRMIDIYMVGNRMFASSQEQMTILVYIVFILSLFISFYTQCAYDRVTRRVVKKKHP